MLMSPELDRQVSHIELEARTQLWHVNKILIFFQVKIIIR